MSNILNSVSGFVAGAIGAVAATSLPDSPPAIIALGGAFILLGHGVGKIFGSLADDAGFAKRIPKPRSTRLYSWEGFGALAGTAAGTAGFVANLLIVLI